MAGAIDDDCLTDEYATAAGKIVEISLLASQKDAVLELAYPLGNPLQGRPLSIAAIPTGTPRRSAAEDGAHCILPRSNRTLQEIPRNLDYGHLDYLPGAPIAAAYPVPQKIPPKTGPNPPASTPAALDPPAKWKPAWSAAFASSRFL